MELAFGHTENKFRLLKSGLKKSAFLRIFSFSEIRKKDPVYLLSQFMDKAKVPGYMLGIVGLALIDRKRCKREKRRAFNSIKFK